MCLSCFSLVALICFYVVKSRLLWSEITPFHSVSLTSNECDFSDKNHFLAEVLFQSLYKGIKEFTVCEGS